MLYKFIGTGKKLSENKPIKSHMTDAELVQFQNAQHGIGKDRIEQNFKIAPDPVE